jgi:hypothetical protein
MGLLSLPSGRSRQDKKRKLSGQEKAKESVGGDEDKVRGRDAKECFGKRIND